MAKKIDKNNFGFLGIDFEFKLTKFFVEDTKFFESVATIVDQNAFTDPLLRNFVGTLKDYYVNQNIVPTYEILNTILRSRAKTDLDIAEIDSLIHKLKFEVGFDGCDYIEEQALSFFRQQRVIKASKKILEMTSNGDTDNLEACIELMQEAIMSGQEDDMGFNIYDMEEKALSNDYTVSVPTGIGDLDDALGGGLDKGKLGLLIAPAGFGKTSFTTAIDSYAATYRCDMNNNEGFKVLQIYFEDDDVDITRKHYARIVSEGRPYEERREAREFKRLDQPAREEIATLLNNHQNKEMLAKNLRLKHFKTGTKSATDIEVFIRKLINSGFKPDLVSIDYFECLAPEKGHGSNDSEWAKEGKTMRKLENMAHDLNIAIWIPTQGTKDSMNSPELVRMDQASGSAKKVHVAQVIMSIARAIGDIDKSRAVISILKNRSGKSGKVFNNVYFDNATCTISCESMEVFDDDLTWKNEYEDQVEKRRRELVRKISESQKSQNSYMPENQPIQNEGNLVAII